MKRIVALFLAIMMMLTAAATAETASDGKEWDTDIRLGITREKQIIQEAGMNLKQWDETVAAKKQAGLADPITRDAILAADANAAIHEEDGTIFQLGASPVLGPITDTLDAYQLAYRLVGILGGNELTDLMIRSRLTMNDTTVYSFQQMVDGHEVLGGTLKIAVNGNKEVTGVFSCVDQEASREQKLITQEEAEAAAAEKASAEILTEYTERTYIAVCDMIKLLNMDLDVDPVPDDIAWVVYTPNSDNTDGYPYTAHYIKLDGTYLRSLPVKEPGDAESLCGYRRKDVFAGMTADTYTGELTDINGNVKTVTLPVMRNEADGCWYLGDVERKIAFADYFEAAYGENHDLVLLKSEDNTWESDDIFTYWNYLHAWQFFADMGWIGPDGEATEVLILKGMCYSSGMSCDNACSFGKIEGWQVFAYSPLGANGEPTRLTWALDVMAHEFTHTFTGTLMNQNLYENDSGAINEAMSDIYGNLIEYICKDTSDTEWLLGENTGGAIRSMSNPEDLSQPASVWGKYYVPQVDKPGAVNDRGGVHFNSSMLNLIAYKLCADYGMSYGDAVRLWTMVTLGITPKTDYLQMSTLLEWAADECREGSQYKEAIGQLIAETRIDRTDMPESLPEGLKVVRLQLPDTPTFTENKDWCLYITQMDVKEKDELEEELLKTFTEMLTNPEKKKEFADSLKQLIANLELKESELGKPKLVLKDENVELKDHLIKRIAEFLEKSEKDIVKGEKTLYTWEEKGSGVIPAVIEDKETFYMLMNLSKGGSQLEKLVYLIGHSWYDLTDFMMNDAYNDDESDSEKLKKLVKELGKQGVRNLLDLVKDGLGTKTTSESGSIKIEELPNTGLEYIEMPATQQQEEAQEPAA